MKTRNQIYLEDPLIEMDNNLVENAIRPTALGKKNWLFFGDATDIVRGVISKTLTFDWKYSDLDIIDRLEIAD